MVEISFDGKTCKISKIVFEGLLALAENTRMGDIVSHENDESIGKFMQELNGIGLSEDNGIFNEDWEGAASSP